MKATNILLLALLCCLIILPCFASVSTVILSSGTIRYNTIPWLHTDGMYVKNENNQIVHLTGVHWADLVDKPFYYYGPGVVNWRTDLAIRTGIVKEMGANHIRYSIHLQKFINDFEYTGDRIYDDYVTWMDASVQELINNELYGYFCIHHGSSAADDFMIALLDNTEYTFTAKDSDNIVTGTYYTAHVRDTWMDWIEELAAYYADTANVFGYQIWAEPAWAGMEKTSANYEILFHKWWQFNLETAQAIHRGNPKAIVVVMSPGYYYTSYMSPNMWDGRWGENYGLLPEPNIIYAVQKYESEDWRGNTWAQKNYSQAYEDWYNGEGTLEDARALQEDWYLEYCFNFAQEYNVPVMNTEFAYCDDMQWNYKDNVNWAWQPEQAEGYYQIWAEYSQGWTQHRWQIGSSYGGGSPWGFFAVVDEPAIGDYQLAPSGQVMSQNFSPLPTS